MICGNQYRLVIKVYLLITEIKVVTLATSIRFQRDSELANVVSTVRA